MQAHGANVVRIGEFAWSAMEPAEGQFDFAWMDRAIAAATVDQQRAIAHQHRASRTGVQHVNPGTAHGQRELELLRGFGVDEARRVLVVHVLDGADPAAVRAQIDQRYAQALKEIFE